jgi:Rrf2 family protein
MHMTARVDHAISAALVLPEPSEPPVAGAALADELGISYPYLMTIIDPLKKAGLARVRRGPQGGLSLARGSHDITLADVIWAVDAPTVVDSRSPHGSTEAADAELLLPRLWATAHEAVFAVFAQVPLARMRAPGTSAAGTSAGGAERTSGSGPHTATPPPPSAQLG